MDLFLVRHAIAQDAAPGMLDADRALTPTGKERFHAVTQWLKMHEVRFELILTSPWRRAVSTAEILATIGGESVITNALAEPPGDTLLGELEETGKAFEARVMACVGHQPWMSELLALLLFGEIGPAHALPFKKGGVAWLSGKPTRGGMHLRAFIPPKWAQASA